MRCFFALHGAVMIKHDLHPFLGRLTVQGWFVFVAQAGPLSLLGVGARTITQFALAGVSSTSPCEVMAVNSIDS